MPSYHCACLSPKGASVRLTRDAPTAAAARIDLRAQGFFPFAITESKVRHKRTKIGRRQLITLFHELGILLESQTLLQALDSLRQHYPHRPLRIMLNHIHDLLASSRASVPDAFATFPATFTPEIVSMIAAGEAAGPVGLSARFSDLEDKLLFEDENRGHLLEAIAYPVGLAVGISTVLAYVFIFLVPKLKDLFATFNSTLPPVTVALFSIAGFLQHHGVVLLGGLLVALAASYALWRTEIGRYAWDSALLRCPLLGDILKNLITANIAKNYASLYEAGRQAPDILASCVTIVSNRRARRVLIEMHRRVAVDGLGPDDAFTAAKFFSPMVVVSIRNGAATGSLARQMKFIARASADTARRRSAAFFSAIKYLALLLIGALVGVVVYGMLAPIMSLGQNIK
jgi:type II secretory pathway component PulF